MTRTSDRREAASLLVAFIGLMSALIGFYVSIAASQHYWPWEPAANGARPTETSSSSAVAPISTATYSLPNGITKIDLTTTPPTIVKNNTVPAVDYISLTIHNQQLTISAGPTFGLAVAGNAQASFEKCMSLWSASPHVVGVIATAGDNFCIGTQSDTLALLTIDSITAQQVSIHIVQWGIARLGPIPSVGGEHPSGPFPSPGTQSPSPTPDK
jgi:hypothetical protein